ncbi:breast cancer type 1 susceptibility protein homolog [Microcaecilia unicolor]|uniref:Breast cancer type 1 susceptibility protein homolog n=1 Tax=Microcaecilia unicolor TaxID=1415580 RepID=A0A6P7X375_9AMPH|nr:breast cancer type 1 susceptibility protein homolog [Microcaecilia unicolor]
MVFSFSLVVVQCVGVILPEEKASFSTWDTQQKKQCIPADGGLATRDDFNKNSQDANNARSPTPPLTPLETQPKERKMPEVARLSIHLLKELKDSISQEDSSYPEKQHKGQERGNQSAACSLASGNTNKRDADDKLNSRNLHCSKGHPPAGDVSSAAKPSSCQPGDELTSPCIPRVASRNSSGESEQKMLTPTLMGVTGFKSPVVVTKRKLSLVASGLNQSELLLVQRFTRKTQSVFSNQITGGTTHVIMKTGSAMHQFLCAGFFRGAGDGLNEKERVSFSKENGDKDINACLYEMFPSHAQGP